MSGILNLFEFGNYTFFAGSIEIVDTELSFNFRWLEQTQVFSSQAQQVDESVHSRKTASFHLGEDDGKRSIDSLQIQTNMIVDILERLIPPSAEDDINVPFDRRR